MAEEAATSEVPMEHEGAAVTIPAEDSENGVSKRAREEGDGLDENGEKKAKTEEEDDETAEGEMEEDGKESSRTAVGPKTFGSSVEMFDYFHTLLRAWPVNLNVNKYEHVMLLELLKKGHLEAERKMGKGVKAFQVRFHPQYKSRCFFLTREDESTEDFSFRKCVDQILPLPENMQVKQDANKSFRGRGGGRGRGRGRGGRR